MTACTAISAATATMATSGVSGSVGDRGIGFQPLHLGAVRVDRIERALEALRLHVRDRPAADAGRIAGGAEDGDRARREQRGEAGKSGVSMISDDPR